MATISFTEKQHFQPFWYFTKSNIYHYKTGFFLSNIYHNKKLVSFVNIFWSSILSTLKLLQKYSYELTPLRIYNNINLNINTLFRLCKHILIRICLLTNSTSDIIYVQPQPMYNVQQSTELTKKNLMCLLFIHTIMRF